MEANVFCYIFATNNNEMRKSFSTNTGTRTSFTGTFVRFGTKVPYKGPPITTLLIKDITNDDGSITEDHVWFSMTSRFENIKDELRDGVKLTFEARIKPYTKGYVNRREWIDERVTDYKLSYPTNIQIVK